VLLDQVASEKDNTGTTLFQDLNAADQADVRNKAEERYLAYVFLRQSGKQHNKLKTDLKNDFTTGDDRYPKNRQAVLHLLDKYSKTTLPPQATSEGIAFVQGGGRGRGGRGGGRTTPLRPYDKEYWKDKECYKCHKKGHPSSHCSKKSQDDDEHSRSTKSSQAEGINKMQKKLKKTFATLETKIEELSKESDLSSSESEEETSNFQCEYLFTQTCKSSKNLFYEQVLLKQSQISLDLTKVILLDNQSTMDLFCNPSLVTDIVRSKKKMHLQSNGGRMTVTQEATLPGYNRSVWFDTNAITNIVALRHLIKQY
jgi:hypothetical protein